MLCERHAIHKHRCHVMQYGNEHENHVSSNGFVCPYNNLIFYRFFYLFVYAYVPSLGNFFSFISFILSSVRFLTVVLLPTIHRYIFRFQFSWFFTLVYFRAFLVLFMYVLFHFIVLLGLYCKCVSLREFFLPSLALDTNKFASSCSTPNNLNVTVYKRKICVGQAHRQIFEFAAQ